MYASSSSQPPRRVRHTLREDDGFSLPELMVVLVIIGILTLLALPRFMGVTTKAKQTEAKMMLSQVHTLQEAYYYERDRYSDDLQAIGFEHVQLVSDEGTARYQITIENADPTGFVALATAVVDFDKDGVFNVWQVDHTGTITERVPD